MFFKVDFGLFSIFNRIENHFKINGIMVLPFIYSHHRVYLEDAEGTKSLILLIGLLIGLSQSAIFKSHFIV